MLRGVDLVWDANASKKRGKKISDHFHLLEIKGLDTFILEKCFSKP